MPNPLFAITALFLKVLGLSDTCADTICYVCVSLSSWRFQRVVLSICIYRIMDGLLISGKQQSHICIILLK